MKQTVIAVSGVKNSGKTTLLEHLIKGLSERGYQIAVVKHDGHDFKPDVPGTDSYRFKEAGAYGTGIYSSSRYCIVKEQKQTDADFMTEWFPEADIIFLEGQKHSKYPKIEVIRKNISVTPVCNPQTVFAYVTDAEEFDSHGIPVLGFHEYEALMDLTEKILNKNSSGDRKQQ